MCSNVDRQSAGLVKLTNQNQMQSVLKCFTYNDKSKTDSGLARSLSC